MTLLAAPVSTREAAALSPFSGCAKRPLRAQNISPSRCTSDRAIMGRDRRCAIIEVAVTVRVNLVTARGPRRSRGALAVALCFQALAPRSPRSPGRPLDRAAGVTNLAAVVGTGACAPSYRPAVAGLLGAALPVGCEGEASSSAPALFVLVVQVAGRDVPPAHGVEGRDLARAALEDLGAAGVEAAALRRAQGARHVALEDD